MVKSKKENQKVSAQRVSPRSRTQQAARKDEGTAIERFVKKELQKKFPKKNIEINSNAGIDLFLKNGISVKVEVKSAREIIPINSKGKRVGQRAGLFTIKQDDYLEARMFAFVVKPVNQQLNWDKDKPLKINYIAAESIRMLLKAQGKFKKSAQTQLSVKTMRSLEKMDLKTLFKR